MADGLAKIRAYRFAGWELSVRLRRLKSPRARRLRCRNSEFNLLAAFLAAPQRVLSREQLLDLSRLHNDEVYDRSIDVQVGRLRKKIEAKDAKGRIIRTERGAGYVFTAAVETVRRHVGPGPRRPVARGGCEVMVPAPPLLVAQRVRGGVHCECAAPAAATVPPESAARRTRFYSGERSPSVASILRTRPCRSTSVATFGRRFFKTPRL